MISIPDWAVTAVLVTGEVYERALVPDCWVPVGPGRVLTPTELVGRGVRQYLDSRSS